MPPTSIEAFCWVKAVLKDPLRRADGPTGADGAIDHPVLQSFRLLREGAVRVEMTAPPPPREGAGEEPESALDLLGVKVPPPSPNEIPRTPRPPASGPTVQTAKPGSSPEWAVTGFWQSVSFAPGVPYEPGQPAVTLVFQPVDGPRKNAEQWRVANPLWFCDAFTVSLLSHTVSIVEA